MRFAVAYLGALAAFAVVDLVWLGLIAKSFYRREMADLIASPFNLKAAAVFYLAYPLGVAYFAVLPAGSLNHALMMGALLGLLAYGTYDLTNLATLRGWSLKLSIWLGDPC
jgi:uncharacterized membrane protein